MPHFDAPMIMKSGVMRAGLVNTLQMLRPFSALRVSIEGVREPIKSLLKGTAYKEALESYFACSGCIQGCMLKGVAPGMGTSARLVVALLLLRPTRSYVLSIIGITTSGVKNFS